MRPTQQTTPEIIEERAVFAAALSAIDASRLVFVDESGLVAGMRSGYGYAPVGQPCVESAPYRKGARTSLIGAISATCGLVASVSGSVDRATFERFVVGHLAPTLEVGDVVIWDNHTIHQSAIVRAAISARGAVLLKQPRYSPDLNGVEMLWSKMKHRVRQARADTAEALAVAIEVACASVRRSDFEGWIGHVQRITAIA